VTQSSDPACSTTAACNVLFKFVLLCQAAPAVTNGASVYFVSSLTSLPGYDASAPASRPHDNGRYHGDGIATQLRQ